MKIYLALAAAALVTGCATSQTYLQTSNDRCVLAGYQPGTAHYQACVRVTAEELARRHNTQVGAAVLVGAVGAAAYSAAVTPKTYHVHVNRY